MQIPRPIVGVHGDDVDVEVPGLVTVRATFLSEGLFDEEAGGDPEEEDLYEVEVTHPGPALPGSLTFPRLMPAVPQEWLDPGPEAEADLLPIERFATVLAWELSNADLERWEDVCQAARHWDSWTVQDLHQRLPPDWTPVPLLPDQE